MREDYDRWRQDARRPREAAYAPPTGIGAQQASTVRGRCLITATATDLAVIAHAGIHDDGCPYLR